MSRRVADVSRAIDEVLATSHEGARVKEAEIAAVRDAAPRNKLAQDLRVLANAARAGDVDVTYADLATCMEGAR